MLNFREIYRKIVEQKQNSKPREAYFVLFFALVITMLMTPIMSQVLLETIETREGIRSYERSSNLLTYANSALEAKLEELSRKGLGYSESGEFVLGDTGAVVHYDFSSKSEVDLGGRAIWQEAHGDNDPWSTEHESDSMYIVPAPGTGTAGENCE